MTSGLTNATVRGCTSHVLSACPADLAQCDLLAFSLSQLSDYVAWVGMAGTCKLQFRDDEGSRDHYATPRFSGQVQVDAEMVSGLSSRSQELPLQLSSIFNYFVGRHVIRDVCKCPFSDISNCFVCI